MLRQGVSRAAALVRQHIDGVAKASSAGTKSGSIAHSLVLLTTLALVSRTCAVCTSHLYLIDIVPRRLLMQPAMPASQSLIIYIDPHNQPNVGPWYNTPIAVHYIMSAATGALKCAGPVPGVNAEAGRARRAHYRTGASGAGRAHDASWVAAL